MDSLSFAVVWLPVNDTLLGLYVIFDRYQIGCHFLLLSWLLEAASNDLPTVSDPLLVGAMDRPLCLLDRGLLLKYFQLVVCQSSLCSFTDNLFEYLHVLVELYIKLTLLRYFVCVED